MMIPLKETLDKYGLKPKGVIQVGAHWAEEHEEFLKCGIERFVYIEPCKEAFEKMCNKFVGSVKWALNGEDNMRQQIENGRVQIYTNLQSALSVLLLRNACGSEEKEMPMYVSHQNQGQSNSLLEPNLHLSQHPEIIFDDAEVVKVVTLDSLKVTGDLLVMDCQGYEGEVLRGGINTIKQVQAIYTECNRGQTYSGNMEINEMDVFLADYGFKRVETFWPSENWTWGDAFYLNVKRYALGKEPIESCELPTG